MGFLPVRLLFTSDLFTYIFKKRWKKQNKQTYDITYVGAMFQ